LLNLEGYADIARKVGKPLMIGEYGALPVLKSNTAVWKETPDYFESYQDETARKWVKKALDEVVAAEVPLVYWWTYSSDASSVQGKKDRFDISLSRDPELVKMVAEANQRLKQRYTAVHNKAFEDKQLNDALPQRLKELWAMDEIRKVPLDVEKLGSSTVPYVDKRSDNWASLGDSWVGAASGEASGDPADMSVAHSGLTIERYYFNGEMTDKGPDRIYAVLAKPTPIRDPVPVILVFHGGGGHANPALATAIARQNPGTAVLAVDYNGQFLPVKGQEATVWRTVDRAKKLTADLKQYQSYHYVIAARRALDFLANQPGIEASHACSFGISNGGWISLIVAGVDNRIQCVVNAVSAGGVEGSPTLMSQAYRQTDDSLKPLYLDTFDPLVYAKYTKAAVLLNLSANDRYMWLPGAMRNYNGLAGEKRLSLTPNSDHQSGGPNIPNSSSDWVRSRLLNDREATLPKIKGDRIVSDGTTYTWEAEGSYPIRKSNLYWSPGQPVSTARYWMPVEARFLDGKWKAEIPNVYAGMAGEAYAIVFDEKNRAVSSMTIDLAGKDPRREEVYTWENDSLWDEAGGASAWRPNQGSKTTAIDAEAGGILVDPGGGATFNLLTNSAILASGFAARHEGVRLTVNGGGAAGTIKISLAKDSNSMEQTVYSASVSYGEEDSVVDIPWSYFHSSQAEADSRPWPFDTLLIEGNVHETSKFNRTGIAGCRLLYSLFQLESSRKYRSPRRANRIERK
jgi:cephalosporin-C deacetylase-like acetyl esterase